MKKYSLNRFCECYRDYWNHILELVNVSSCVELNEKRKTFRKFLSLPLFQIFLKFIVVFRLLQFARAILTFRFDISWKYLFGFCSTACAPRLSRWCKVGQFFSTFTLTFSTSSKKPPANSQKGIKYTDVNKSKATHRGSIHIFFGKIHIKKFDPTLGMNVVNIYPQVRVMLGCGSHSFHHVLWKIY